MPPPRAPLPRDTGFQPVLSPLLHQRHLLSRILFLLYLLTLPSILFVIQGCCPKCPDPNAFHPNPPLRSVSDVISAINANNQKIPTLWATLNYTATIKEKGQTHSITSDDGTLLFMRPNRFRLVGNKEFVGPVFDMGVNDTEFWLEVKPTNAMYSATFAQLAQASGTRINFPIRPDLVAEVLGVSTFNQNLLDPPFPIMRYEASTDSYVFLFARQGPHKYFAQREIWYDRTTLRPRRLVLYDLEGSPQLDARLTSDKPVQVPDQPRDQWPVIAGDFKLFFPDTGNHMEFSLKDIRLYREMRRTLIPNDGSFDKPDITGTDVHQEPIPGLNVE